MFDINNIDLVESVEDVFQWIFGGMIAGLSFELATANIPDMKQTILFVLLFFGAIFGRVIFGMAK